MSNIKAEIVELADKLTKTFAIDKANGNVTVTGDPFTDNLPEGVTLDQIKAVDDCRYNFIAASGKALGDAAVAAMLKHKTIDTVVGTFSLGGKNEVSHEILRAKEVFNPSSKEMMVKHGAMTTTVKTVLNNQKTGQVGAVRASIGELALKLAKEA